MWPLHATFFSLCSPPSCNFHGNTTTLTTESIIANPTRFPNLTLCPQLRIVQKLKPKLGNVRSRSQRCRFCLFVCLFGLLFSFYLLFSKNGQAFSVESRQTGWSTTGWKRARHRLKEVVREKERDRGREGEREREGERAKVLTEVWCEHRISLVQFWRGSSGISAVVEFGEKSRWWIVVVAESVMSCWSGTGLSVKSLPN